MAITCFIYVSLKFVGCVFTNFSVFCEWIIWVIEGLLSLHLAESVKDEKDGTPKK